MPGRKGEANIVWVFVACGLFLGALRECKRIDKAVTISGIPNCIVGRLG